MKLSIICFTEAGARLSVKLIKELLKAGQPCEAYGWSGLIKSCPDGDHDPCFYIPVGMDKGAVFAEGRHRVCWCNRHCSPGYCTLFKE